jgi:thioesterase domain-containing protein
LKEIKLQEYLYDHIPLSKALGISVQLATIEQVILQAPLDLNINHKKTAFGGSLYSVATLACWSLVFLNVRCLNIHSEIVISGGDIKYLAPVKDDFTVKCIIENQEELLRFKMMLHKKSKSRIRLNARIYQGSCLAVDYAGDFVALKDGSAM